MVKLTDIVKEKLDTVDTVADLQGLTGVEGQQVSVASYHGLSDLSGGGTFVWGTGRHNGGTFIDPTRAFPTGWNDQAQLAAWFADSGVNVSGWERKNPTNATVDMFGAKGDSGSRIQDDTKSIKKCYEVVRELNAYNMANFQLGSGTNTGARNLDIFGSAKIYCISETINFPTYYDNIEFNKCLFLPHPSFDLVNPAFNFLLYNTEVNNLRLGMFDFGFTASNTNLNIGKVEFNGLQASNVDKLCELTLRSTITTFENYRFDRVRLVANIIDGDKVIFGKGWFSAGVLSNQGDAHFILESNSSPSLELDQMLYVPTTQTTTVNSVVRINAGVAAGRVTINAGLFGAEPGQIPLVANYGVGRGLGRGVHITINNTSGFTTGARGAVELFSLPNSVVFNDYYGGIEESHAYGLVYFREDVQTFDEAVTELGTFDFGIYINGRTPSNYLGWPNSMSTKLMQYDRSAPRVFRKRAVNVTNSTGSVVLNKNRAGRERTLKIQLVNDGNNAADRYSEYLATSNGSGAVLGVWSIVPIFEGTSTIAGRLRLDGLGNVEVICNSATASNFYVIMSEIVSTDPF